MNAIILHTIIIYTLSYCPYCIKAKELLNKKKKTKMEENQTTENTEQKDILEQNESVNNDVPEIDENSTPIVG